VSGRGVRTIGDVAQFVTSKKAGPVLLTLDIAFADQVPYRNTQDRGLHLTEDFRESAAAFAGKRKPALKGR
jgi:hypothetical protein